jgi:hypothetical protein
MTATLETFCRWLLFVVIAAVPAAAGAVDTDTGGRYPSFWRDDSLRAQVLAGIEATGNDRYAIAESLFSDLSRRFPSSPVGPLFVAGTFQAQMLDCESSERYAEFRVWLTETERRARALIGLNTAVSEAEFALGAAAGYDAVYESQWGGWFAALKKAMRANGHFQAALAADSSFFDAYLGIGNYNYWKSAGTGFLRWLPFIPDTRERGLQQMLTAAQRGTFARQAARASLATALLHEERYAEALAHADTLAARFPEAKSPLWIMAQADFKLYRWEASRDLYGEIERRILLVGPGNYYNLIECAYYRARCDFEDGRWRDALTECHRALAYPAPWEIKDRQKDKLKELRKLQERLKRLVATTSHAE